MTPFLAFENSTRSFSVRVTEILQYAANYYLTFGQVSRQTRSSLIFLGPLNHAKQEVLALI